MADVVRRLIRRVPLILLGAAIGVALVESALRVGYPAEVFERRFRPQSGPSTLVAHPFLPYAGKPGYRYSLLLDLDGKPAPVSVQHNDYGLRTHELPQAKTESDFFIVAVGGSTTWGTIAESNEATWPGLLESMLAEAYPDRNVRVFNFGTAAATTAYNVVLLSLVGVHIDPDLVLVYHGFNDYGPVFAVDHKTDHSHHFRDFDPSTASRGIRGRLPQWAHASYTITFTASLLDRLAGVNDLQAAAELDHPEVIQDLDLAAQRILPNLETLHSIASGAGAEVLFSTFQFRDGDDPGRQAVNRTFRRYFDERGFAYVDQDALLPDGDETLQFDQCHFTDRGRELLARNFFDAIVERGYIAGGAHRAF